MSDTLNLSAAFMAALAADPISLFLHRGGSWFEADQMFYRRRLTDIRAQLASTDPTDTERRRDLLRTEAQTLVNLGQMTTDELNSLFPASVVASAPASVRGDDDSSSTVSLASNVSICSTRTSKGSRPPQRSSHRSSGSHHKSAPVSRQTPARPTRPVLPEAPKKVTFGTQSRFAALLSDSE